MNRADVALVCCGVKLHTEEDEECLRGTDVQPVLITVDSLYSTSRKQK